MQRSYRTAPPPHQHYQRREQLDMMDKEGLSRQAAEQEVPHEVLQQEPEEPEVPEGEQAQPILAAEVVESSTSNTSSTSHKNGESEEDDYSDT
eukprot:5145957-Amphidinium_carterae.1